MFNLYEYLEMNERDKFFEGLAFFCDKAGLLEIVFMRYSSIAKFHEIISFNEDGEQTGFSMVYVYPDERLYLSEIYCYRKFRGLGIGSNLSLLMDFITQQYEGYVMRWVRNPYEANIDKTAGVVENKSALLERANRFYEARGFDIIEHDEYIADPMKYPLVDYEKDFINHEEVPNCIVLKKISKEKSPYAYVDGILIHENAISKIDDIKSFVRKKSFYLHPKKD